MTPPSRKLRLDLALTRAGLAPTREKAQALIIAGRVLVDGQKREKSGTPVAEEARLELLPGRRPYVSRAGGKLAGVLDSLGVDPLGKRCLDVGASTGGFTEVLLRRGATHVTALDVGRGLIDASLRSDARVHVVERVNARYLTPEQVEPPYDLATVDLSFISLTLVLDAIFPLLTDGELLAMVKPQFEVGRDQVGRKGVVRNPSLRAAAVIAVAHFIASRGWGVLGVRASPVAGPKGNREVFIRAAAGEGLDDAALHDTVREEVTRD